MENFLEKLFFGEIRPHLDNARLNDLAQSQVEAISSHEDELIGLLEGRSRELFWNYSTAWSELDALSSVEYFSMGFRLGARLMLAALEEPAGMK